VSLFVSDAAVLGLKEALKLMAVWFLLKAYLKNASAEHLLKWFYAGLGLTTLVFGTLFFWPPEMDLAGFFSSLTKYVFFIFFLGSIIVLYLELARKERKKRPLHGSIASVAILLLTLLYFFPDIIGSSLHIRELAFMRENGVGVYLSGAAGFAFTLAASYVLLRNRGNSVGVYFGLGQLLLILTLIKLLGGGAAASGNISLIPAVQRGAMKLVHDFVHQIFVFLLVPDHPLFTTGVWVYIGFLFGSNFGLAAALLIILLPPFVYLYESLTAPLPETDASVLPSERRIYRAAARRAMRRRALPVVVFILTVFISWYTEIGASSLQLYIPQPKPVVEDKGVIIIPINDPTMDLMDGSLHKFSVTRGSEEVNFLIIKRPDGRLAVALDACEICPPEGYGLTEDKVVCLYCRTPIPLTSLGREGGCNPIPLRAQITEKDIRIDVSELDAKWQSVKSGKTREGIK
jgi:hypothetical protein